VTVVFSMGTSMLEVLEVVDAMDSHVGELVLEVIMNCIPEMLSVVLIAPVGCWAANWAAIALARC
jgi:hypothetical protein